MVCAPEGGGALKLDDIRLHPVQGHQAVLQVVLDGGLRDEEGLHVPETTAQRQPPAAGSEPKR